MLTQRKVGHVSIKDDLHRLVDELPEERLRAVEWLLRISPLPEHVDLQELIAEQGFRPLQDPLALASGIWPDNEEVDDFLAARVQWRREEERG
jgi:hypothetical protein